MNLSDLQCSGAPTSILTQLWLVETGRRKWFWSLSVMRLKVVIVSWFIFLCFTLMCHVALHPVLSRSPSLMIVLTIFTRPWLASCVTAVSSSALLSELPTFHLGWTWLVFECLVCPWFSVFLLPAYVWISFQSKLAPLQSACGPFFFFWKTKHYS